MIHRNESIRAGFLPGVGVGVGAVALGLAALGSACAPHPEEAAPPEAMARMSCADLAETFRPVLGEEMRAVTGGDGCGLTRTSTGAEFESIPSILRLLEATIPGWVEVLEEAADGPTGSFMTFTRGDQRLSLEVAWSPTPEAEATCPGDQPLGACELSPEDEIFTVQVTLSPARES